MENLLTKEKKLSLLKQFLLSFSILKVKTWESQEGGELRNLRYYANLCYAIIFKQYSRFIVAFLSNIIISLLGMILFDLKIDYFHKTGWRVTLGQSN